MFNVLDNLVLKIKVLEKSPTDNSIFSVQGIYTFIHLV